MDFQYNVKNAYFVLYPTVENQLLFNIFRSFHTKIVKPNLSLLIFFPVIHSKAQLRY